VATFIGQTVPLAVFVYNDTVVPPVLATATVVITVTDPAGASTTPTVANPSTGSYTASFVTALAGRHTVRATGTSVAGVSGQNTAEEWEFDVAAASSPLVSIDDVKEFLNFTTSDDDEELETFINAASDALERWCGRTFRRQTVTAETHDGSSSTCGIQLRKAPAISVTSVSEIGVTLTASDYALRTDSGVLVRLSGSYTEGVWPDGILNISVTYVAGYADVPDDVSHACLLLIKHLWRTQRGGSPLARNADGLEYAPGTAWTYPLAVQELVASYQLPGFG
jgi:uncharacterized phiE125 gp8 family phage protein